LILGFEYTYVCRNFRGFNKLGFSSTAVLHKLRIRKETDHFENGKKLSDYQKHREFFEYLKNY
jgi:hypothetical protein